MSTKIEAIIPLPGLHFGADWYIKATIEVESFGTPESGRQTWGDPENYDPGSGPEWSIVGTPELFLDSGGYGEAVTIGPQTADAIREFIESDKAVIEQVGWIISKEHAEA